MSKDKFEEYFDPEFDVPREPMGWLLGNAMAITYLISTAIVIGGAYWFYVKLSE